MQLRHILAVVDFSTDAGINAAWRAAHLARAHQSELCLLSLVELADKHPGSRFGATAPPARARSDLLHLASHMRDTLNLFPAVIVGVGSEGRDMLAACARRADLVVLAPASRLAERLVTECGVPVLTARQASHHARRSALVVHEPRIADLQPLLGAAQWLCKPDGIHALKLLDRRLVRLLQAADQPLPAIHDRSQIAEQRAQLNLQTELARAGLRHTQGAVLAAVNGSRLLQQQMRLGATVVVLGQQRQSSWLAWLQPSLARQFSRQAACDVLIVPDRLPTAKEARWTLNRGRQEGALRLEH